VKLARYGAPGAEKPALVEADGTLRDLSAVLADIDPTALSDTSLSRIAAVDVKSLPVVTDLSRIGPPVARTGKIVCIGLNCIESVSCSSTASNSSSRGVNSSRAISGGINF
jgi:2-keto-4-pentenoate hydratase/2-oxohepta-3-ene-1,7-dioic acid hydratase in catechol pathway